MRKVRAERFLSLPPLYKVKGENGKVKGFIHPLRFARPPCLRGTVCWRGERLIFALLSVICHLCSVSPCLRGTKLIRNAITHNRHNAITHFLPLRQGANEVFREMTKCHFVPHEGSTTQCDAGPNHAVGRGWIKQLTLLSLNRKVRYRLRLALKNNCITV